MIDNIAGRSQKVVSTEIAPHAQHAALLVDFDNVTMGIRSDLQNQLRKLLSDSLDALAQRQVDADRTTLLQEIQRDIVLSGIARIRAEQVRVLKHRTLSTAIEVAGLSLPLTLLHGGTVADVLCAFLTASVGATLAKGLNTLRDELSALRKTPGYAALKLRLDQN